MLSSNSNGGGKDGEEGFRKNEAKCIVVKDQTIDVENLSDHQAVLILRKIINGEELDFPVAEIDLYAVEPPWRLFNWVHPTCNENCWIVYSPIRSITVGGSKTARNVENQGTWRNWGKKIEIRDGDQNLIGKKSRFTFTGDDPDSSTWILHEVVLEPRSDFALCLVRKKPNNPDSKKRYLAGSSPSPSPKKLYSSGSPKTRSPARFMIKRNELSKAIELASSSKRLDSHQIDIAIKKSIESVRHCEEKEKHLDIDLNLSLSPTSDIGSLPSTGSPGKFTKIKGCDLSKAIEQAARMGGLETNKNLNGSLKECLESVTCGLDGAPVGKKKKEQIDINLELSLSSLNYASNVGDGEKKQKNDDIGINLDLSLSYVESAYSAATSSTSTMQFDAITTGNEPLLVDISEEEQVRVEEPLADAENVPLSDPDQDEDPPVTPHPSL